MLRKILALAVLCVLASPAHAQILNPVTPLTSGGSPIGPTTPLSEQITDGTNGPVAVKPPSTTALATDKSLVVQLAPNSPGIGVDPCSYALKKSAPIAIASATTTSLVAVSGATTVFVCGFSVTISEVVTTANTILFEYGTGAACSTPTSLTGTYGSGGVTAGAPITVSYGNGFGTIFASAASAGICAVTAIGASGSFEGVLTYVQQ